MARFGLTHGNSRAGQITPEYVAWLAMRQRCLNPKRPVAKYYSNRGISISPEWQDPIIFLSDMGLKPSAEHTLGRINNDDGYSKENCRWETLTEQNRNRRSVKLTLVIAKEIRKSHEQGSSLRNLGAKFGVNKETIRKVVMGRTWKEDHEYMRHPGS
jgi:hypothetical protein